MGPKHIKFQITSLTRGIINKANVACEAIDVTCLKLKKVRFGHHMWKIEKPCVYVYKIHHYMRGVGFFSHGGNYLAVVDHKYCPSMYDRYESITLYLLHSFPFE